MASARRKLPSTTLSPAASRNKGRSALAEITDELVDSIGADLAVDWADRSATEAKIRAKIKRLLRTHKYRPPPPAGRGGGDHGVDYAAQLVLDQANALYRCWSDVEVGDRLFV